MKKFSLIIVAPIKLRGLGKDIESITKYKDSAVYIKVKDCDDIKSLDLLINQGDTPDFILLFESILDGRANKEKAYSEVLEVLKTIKFTKATKLVIAINNNQKNNTLEFVNALIKLDIQDFYYIDEFDKLTVLEWLFKKKELKDNLDYLSTNITKQAEKEVIIREIPKYIEVPVENKTRKLFGFGKQKTQGPSATTSSACRIIGIVAAFPGAGATGVCVGLAEQLQSMGHRILIMDRSDNKDLMNISIKGIDIHDDAICNVSKYDYILIDFGTYVEIRNEKPHFSDESSEHKGLERQLCESIILVASSCPWKLKTLSYYINNDVLNSVTNSWLYLICGPQNKDSMKVISNLCSSKKIFAFSEREKPYEDLAYILGKEGLLYV